MKIVFAKTGIEQAPKGYTRVRLTSEPASTRRFVRENGYEVLEIGAGKPEEMNKRRFAILMRAIVNTAKQHAKGKIAIDLFDGAAHYAALNDTPETRVQTAVENVEMANFEFRTFKSKPREDGDSLEEIRICGASSKTLEAAAKRGQVIAQEVNRARELVNTPGGHLTPRKLSQAAARAVRGLPVEVSTLGRAQIQKLGMGLLAGVGEGSMNEPTLTVMTYAGGKKSERPMVLIGKGITFDAGGLNLKPSSGIYEMHMDMSGAAAIIHTVALAARLKLKRNVIGVFPAAENLVGPNATRPGDIHTSLSGKTVEITDTDAEGRLVLADALTYAKRFKPAVVIDVATLTGAAVVALGLHASGLMTRDDALADTLLALGETSGDYLWRLPLWDEYESVVKSDFADLQNHSIEHGRWGGATNGAIFLWQFAKELDCPWAHIDIAPRMTAAPGDELAKGAAGAPVRLLISFLEHEAR